MSSSGYPEMERMKILYLLAGGHYGSSYQERELLGEVINRGHEPIIVTPNEQNTTLNFAKTHNLPIYVLSLLERSYKLRLAWELAQIAKEQDVDLIHTFYTFRGRMLVRMAGLLSSIPVISHVGTQPSWNDNKIVQYYQKVYESLTSRIPGATIAVSNAIKRELVDIGVPSHKVFVIPNGVSIQKIQDAMHLPLPKNLKWVTKSPNIIGQIGRLSEGKGCRESLFAAASVIKVYPEAKFLFIGDEGYGSKGYREKLEELANSLSISENVIFTGYLPRSTVWSLLHHLTLVVLPSHSEGMPLSILEAMAAAKPIVATTVGGIPEVVTQGMTGFLVPPQEPRKLASAIQSILNDPYRAQQMGQRGFEYVQNEFSLKRNHEYIFELYSALTNRGANIKKVGKFTT